MYHSIRGIGRRAAWVGGCLAAAWVLSDLVGPAGWRSSEGDDSAGSGPGVAAASPAGGKGARPGAGDDGARGAADLSPAGFARSVAPLLTAHCVKCHGPVKKDGELTLHQLKGDAAAERATWASVLERLQEGDMPPPKEPRPPAPLLRAATEWLTAAAKSAPLPDLPKYGNMVPHELLFGKPAGEVEPLFGRLWRFRPEAYFGAIADIYRGRQEGFTQPFAVSGERGFTDYASTGRVDEATTEILLRNAERVVALQTAHTLVDGKPKWANDTVREFQPLFQPDAPPTRAQLEVAIAAQFKLATARKVTPEETERLLALYDRSLKVADRTGAARTMLAAVLLRPDSIFRTELGAGAADGRGRVMLAPRELATALSLALRDRRDAAVHAAAEKGELTTRDQVAAHVDRMLSDPKVRNTQMLRFFREWFDYGLATEIFKDKPRTHFHEPRQWIADTDRLVLWVLERDRDVLRELLTTTKSFVNYTTKQNKQTRKDDPARAIMANPTNDKGRSPPEAVYGFDAWPAEQPAEVPGGIRMGILMQPAWLIAHSTNFDNDTVRRGKWVRERLLGGHIPDLPIGVVAQVPDERHRTFRDRLNSVTRAAQCWRCHQKMDDLGLPFEQFDHFGLHRGTETVLDPVATEKNVDKKGKPLGPVMKELPLDTTGLVADAGDPGIEGAVKDPYDLVRRLAGSTRVRQVFVRHAFRFFLGRNETPGDAKTLQDADRAYVEGGGSFKALVRSLLLSDSFLLRRAL